EPLYFTQDPEETIIDLNTLTIEWQTNAESETRLLYGTTPSYELGDIELTEMTTEHLIELSDLQAATVYYVAAVSSDGVNMTPVKEWVVCTKSESTGTIDVFFNHPVNTSVATETEAIYNPDFTGLYVEYIESATQTLDIAMYDWHEIPSALIDAINTAHAQGILVRIVTDSEIENTALADLASALPVVFGTDEGIMHDKFLIIDVDLITAKVVGGSTNWTDSNLGWDFNNIVTIEDQSLARAYTLEFNEMFGSSDGTPNPLFSRFGAEKLDNTPHKFEIGEIPVELYFSPSDGATAQMVEHLHAAESRIDFGIMVFTENSLGNSMLAAHNSVEVSGIIDYVEFNGSEFNLLVDGGVDVLDYMNEDGTQWPDGPVFHHKYCMIDHAVEDENPILITGSHNWSASAENINDENTLIIFDHSLANQFYQEYTQRRQEQLDLSIETAQYSQVQAFPNPIQDVLNIDSKTSVSYVVQALNGKTVAIGFLEVGTNQIDLSVLETGMYFLSLESGQNLKLIKN
ncbi:MAG: phospholipase D-like domain-containing protein, partial [Flavobacteriales bacterium]